MRRLALVVLLLSTACGHAASPSRITLAATATHGAQTVPGTLQPPFTRIDDARTADARAWLMITDGLCHEARGLVYGSALSEIMETPTIAQVTSHDVSFELAREAFFDANDDKLHAASFDWLARIAKTFRALSAGASLLVSLTIEDEARPSSAAVRTVLQARRAEAITTALVATGIDRAKIATKSTIELWEGDYDGPSNLDPAEGRVVFAVVR